MRPALGSPAGGAWTRRELAILDRLRSPQAIQGFLDRIEYSADPFYRSPRRVLRDRKAHCFDGALFAAAAIRRLGHRPLVVDLRAENDDDHMIAVFRHGGRLGAVAKSNFVGLRYREPLFRDLRELVLSFFEDFYNVARQKTLRSYSVPLDLTRFDAVRWETSEEGLELIAERLDSARHFGVLTRRQAGELAPVDVRRYRAGLMGSNPKGLYRPRR
ncbi:MAG: hypothetical protein LAO05_08615 [Acidobacteriia bacterium]|nr:hypothetical protein [Terriglobia bacterium]